MTGTNRLILLRHAKSDWYSGERDDYLRPLSDRGIYDARRIGRWLAQADYVPETVLTSPSTRTRETLRLLGVGMGRELCKGAIFAQSLYHGSPAMMREVLALNPAAANAMIVGHNPGLEDFLRWLVPASELPDTFTKLFPTCALYVLTTNHSLHQLARGCMHMVAHQRPRQLGRDN